MKGCRHWAAIRNQSPSPDLPPSSPPRLQQNHYTTISEAKQHGDSREVTRQMQIEDRQMLGNSYQQINKNKCSYIAPWQISEHLFSDWEG